MYVCMCYFHGNYHTFAKVPARLWTSTMRRTRETAQFIVQNKILISEHELDCGSASSER